MNERIKELAEESGLSYLSSVHPSMLEKFAELVVQECSKVADDNFDKGLCPVGNYIKQHFGVEQ
jgi:hypothetical protein